MSATVLQGWGERLRGWLPGLPRLRGGAEGVADGQRSSIPVRDWINVGGAGQPTKFLGFDQALVCVVIGLLAMGLVMVYSATTTHTSVWSKWRRRAGQPAEKSIQSRTGTLTAAASAPRRRSLARRAFSAPKPGKVNEIMRGLRRPRSR